MTRITPIKRTNPNLINKSDKYCKTKGYSELIVASAWLYPTVSFAKNGMTLLTALVGFISLFHAFQSNVMLYNAKVIKDKYTDILERAKSIYKK